MKTFHQYLAESERTYDYRIKILGDVPQEFIKNLEEKMAQFDIVKISRPKTTPVQKLQKDFPGAENQSVTFMDVSFRYPAIEPQIKQLAQLLGLNPNFITLQTQAYDDSIAKEIADITAQNTDLIADTDYPAPDAEQRALSQDYSANPYQHAVLKNEYRSDFTVAGGKTPPAKTTNDIPTQDKSPFNNIKRQPRPATGANPRG
jgi:hypothetical protein